MYTVSIYLLATLAVPFLIWKAEIENESVYCTIYWGVHMELFPILYSKFYLIFFLKINFINHLSNQLEQFLKSHLKSFSEMSLFL